MTQAWEIENFLDVRDGVLHIDSVSASALARERGTPLFVFSESRIRHNIARLQRAGDAIPCPLKICYAAKAMSTMGILQAVKDAGIDIEVNSGGELWKALKAGFTGGQIIFNGTSKEVWEIENAINAGIYAIQVDSLYELSLIEETAKRLDKCANVSLRLVPEIESGTHSGLQTALLTSKFGMMPDEAFSAFHTYKDSPHLALCGIHLHVGSQNPDPAVYTQALVILFESVLRIFEESGVRLKHVNLGGGFPVNYLRNERVAEGSLDWFRDQTRKHFAAKNRDISETEKIWARTDERRSMLSAGFEPAEALRVAWESISTRTSKWVSSDLFKELTILLEPGRSIIADAGICLTTVRNMKERPLQGGIGGIRVGPTSEKNNFEDNWPTKEKWLLTDAGFNILLSMETYKWYYHLISATRAGDSHETMYKLAGPLCDGGDVYFDIERKLRLPEHRLLPENVEPGEVLALLNCGAYSLAQASQYNGRFLPAVVLICSNGEVKQIRKRDNFEDLIANDIY
ncbi:MAG TPA: diaminopimelate decarboxylase [Pyrinomonadaceae bacterium]|nr:diaminopimelate decarboxylase [Pyrinomonadaceae bacterium]